MIVLFTDFGSEGPYVGQMKARLLKYAPDSVIIDLMHDVPAYDIEAASELLYGLQKEFEPGSIFICVVDPGVGGARKPIFIDYSGKTFVGPDNGLFSLFLKEGAPVSAYEITWRPKKLSNSFHGRDLFAPVGAMLKAGKSFDHCQRDVSELVQLAQAPRKIIYQDHFGNLWTNITEDRITSEDVFRINNMEISYASVFSDTPKGRLFWYINASGYVEFAINQGHCADFLKLCVGSEF